MLNPNGRASPSYPYTILSSILFFSSKKTNLFRVDGKSYDLLSLTVFLCCVEPPGRDQGRDERQGLLGDWADPQTPSDAWGNRKRGLEHQRTAEKGKIVLLKWLRV